MFNLTQQLCCLDSIFGDIVKIDLVVDSQR